MNNILLSYVIEKSYESDKAQEVLNRYDAARTGKPIEEVRLVNSLIRHGNTKLARQIVTQSNKGK